MAGEIDLFSGSRSFTGSNKFRVDKNPLSQLYGGVEDVIGKQAGALGANIVTGVVQYVQKIAGAIIDAILGLPLELLSSLEPELLQSFLNADKFFTNILGFLGGIDPLSELFSIEEAAQAFINNVLAETGLLPILDGAGHLAQAALQPLIDAIAQSFGLPAGLSFSGLETALNNYIVNDIVGVSQAILDAIANALGHPGTGHTPTEVGGYLANIPGSIVSGVSQGWLTALNALHLNDPLALIEQIPRSIPALVRDVDGGLSAVGGGLTRGADGAILFVEDGLTHLVQQADQGIVSLQHIGEQLVHAAAVIANPSVPTVAAPVSNPSVADVMNAGHTAQAALVSAIEQVGTTVENDIVAGAAQFGGFVQAAGTNAQGLVGSINSAAVGILSGGSAALVDAESNIAALFGGAPQFLQGISGIFGQGATNIAFSSAASNTASLQTKLTQFQNSMAAVFNVSPATVGNINVSVDFSTMANAATMAGVMSPGNTSIGITGGAAAWQSASSGTAAEVFPTQTATDYQIITVTLGPLNDIFDPTVQTWITARENSSRDTRIILALTSSGGVPGVTLDTQVSGHATSFATAFVPTMSSGGIIKIFLGDPASLSPYAMQVLYNGTPIITYADGSTVSQIGLGQRYVGLDMVNNVSGKYPPAIRSVSYQDNPPTPAAYPYSGLPAAGTKGRMYWPNDVGLALRDNGSAWETVWGGPLSAFTPPAAFSTTAGSGGTFSSDKGSRVLDIATGSFTWNMEYNAVSPASNYICQAYFETLPYVNDDTFQAPSIILYDSVSGKLVTWGLGYDPSSFKLQALKWNSLTSFNAAYTNLNVGDVMGYGINWWQMRDDGTNRYFEYSFNGVDFYTAGSSLRTDFITPTHIGWGASRFTITAFKHRLRSWKYG